MCGAQNDAWRIFRFKCLLPTRSAQAPPVAGQQTRKAEFWHRGGKIIAARFGKREKLRCHHCADGVAAYVLMSGIAAAIAIKPVMGLNEHISNGSPSTLRAGTGLLPPSPRSSLSTLSPLKFFGLKRHEQVYISSKPVLCIMVGYPLNEAR
jgi:hypothetical protein